MQDSTITISTFINTIFEGLQDDERVCLTCVGDDGKFTSYPASARRLQRFRPGELPWYFCVSSVSPPTDTGYLGRTHDDLQYAYCLVLDDIGTAEGSKASVPPVEPTWKLESSEGNFQWGYVIEALELTPENLAYYEGCVRGIAAAGYSDPGARGAYRIMRVPGSLHRSGFVSRVAHWAPSRWWDLPSLMSALGVEPMAQRVRRSYASNGVVDINSVADPLLDWLQARGDVLGVSSRWVHITCPWQHEHTTDTGAQSTSYSPAGLGNAGRAFSCLHGHCAGRTTADFIAWAGEEGAPDTTAPRLKSVQLDNILKKVAQ